LIPLLRPIGLAASISGLAWDENPDQVREINREKLVKLGVSESVIEQFLANHYYTLSGETRLVQSLGELGKIPGQEELLIRASYVDSPQLATFFLLSAALLRQYHLKTEPLIEILPETVAAGVMTESGRIVLLFPGDHLVWTEELADQVNAMHEKVRKNYPEAPLELRLTRSASQLFRRNIENLGWTLVEKTASYESLIHPDQATEN
jgi:hypothetical protein